MTEDERATLLSEIRFAIYRSTSVGQHADDDDVDAEHFLEVLERAGYTVVARAAETAT